MSKEQGIRRIKKLVWKDIDTLISEDNADVDVTIVGPIIPIPSEINWGPPQFLPTSPAKVLDHFDAWQLDYSVGIDSLSEIADQVLEDIKHDALDRDPELIQRRFYRRRKGKKVIKKSLKRR